MVYIHVYKLVYVWFTYRYELKMPKRKNYQSQIKNKINPPIHDNIINFVNLYRLVLKAVLFCS